MEQRTSYLRIAASQGRSHAQQRVVGRSKVWARAQHRPKRGPHLGAIEALFRCGPALFAATPAFASSWFLVDFEKSWDFANGDVNGHYSGGTAADGTSGGNLGVSFVNVSGLSNDSSFTYYTGAPSLIGTACAHTSVTFKFAGTARSFDLTGSANLVGIDNISAVAAVPEPSTVVLMLGGGVAALRTAARRRGRAR